VFKPESTQ